MVKGQHEYHPSVKYGMVGVYTFPSFLQPSKAEREVELLEEALEASRTSTAVVTPDPVEASLRSLGPIAPFFPALDGRTVGTCGDSAPNPDCRVGRSP